MIKIQALTLLAAIAFGMASSAQAENIGIASKAAASKDVDAATAPAAVKAKAVRENKLAKPSDAVKRNVATSTAREGTSDPYAVPLFKDARQLR